MLRPAICSAILAVVLVLPLVACDPGPPPAGSSSAPAPAPAPAPSTPPVQAGELGGTAWELANITTGSGKVATPDDPSRYQVSFAPDGTVGIKADCNQAGGLWVSTQPGKLAIGGVTSTLAICPADSLAVDFLNGLEGATVYSFEGEALRLTTATGGSMLLTRA